MDNEQWVLVSENRVFMYYQFKYGNGTSYYRVAKDMYKEYQYDHRPLEEILLEINHG
jgi:hypothetical protein